MLGTKTMLITLSLFSLLLLLQGPSPCAATFSAFPLTQDQQEALRERGELEHAIAARDKFLDSAGKELGPRAPLRISVGEGRVLVVLVDFDDNPHQQDVEHFEAMLFSEQDYSTGSFRDYYEEASYGKFDFVGDIVGWYRMPESYQYYTNNYYGFGEYPRNAQKMVEDAVEAADPDVDFSDYDNDKNGFVDMLIVVHAGGEGAGDRSAIWSHVSAISRLLPLDGVYVYTYATCPELSTIGVYCHEFGHLLGLPDLYDTDYSSTGLGAWSVMASGAHVNGGRTPAHFDAWCKVRLGWIDPIVVQENLVNVEIPAVQDEPVVYKLWREGKPDKEYFLVENRQKKRFDQFLPGGGLLIYHIDDAVHHNRDETHYRVAVEQADGSCDLEHGRAADAGDPFPGSSDNRQFDSHSEPNSLDYSGSRTDVAVVAISDSKDVMTANLAVFETEPELVIDAIDVEDEGNGDGQFSPGERLSIRVRLLNRGYYAKFVDGLLETDDEFVTLGQASLTFPAIAKNEAVWSQDSCELEIASQCPCPHVVSMRLGLTVGDFSARGLFEFWICSTYSMTFEQKDVFWEHKGLNGSEDQWHQSSLRNSTKDGLRSAKCGAVSRFDDYSSNLNAALISPIIGMKEGTVISFWHWLDAETDADAYGIDVGVIEATQDGQDWCMLYPDRGYPSEVTRAVDVSMAPGTPCFSGSTGVFEQVTVTCPDGLTLQQFRFRFISNGVREEEGWYIDDVTVTAPQSVPSPPIVSGAGFMHSQLISPGEMLHVVAMVQAFAEGNSIEKVELLFGGVPLGVYLNDDGVLGDASPGDGIYSTLLQVPDGMTPGQYLVQIVAWDAQGQTSQPWPQLAVRP